MKRTKLRLVKETIRDLASGQPTNVAQVFARTIARPQATTGGSFSA